MIAANSIRHRTRSCGRWTSECCLVYDQSTVSAKFDYIGLVSKALKRRVEQRDTKNNRAESPVTLSFEAVGLVDQLDARSSRLFRNLLATGLQDQLR